MEHSLVTIVHQVGLCARKSKYSLSARQRGITKLMQAVCKQETEPCEPSPRQTVTDCCDLFCLSVFLLKMLVFLSEGGVVGLM